MNIKYSLSLCVITLITALSEKTFSAETTLLKKRVINSYSKRSLALHVREFLSSKKNAKEKINELKSSNTPLSLESWLNSSVLPEKPVTDFVNEFKQATQAASLEIPEVWLYEPQSSLLNQTNYELLITYAPEGDEADWNYLEAFDLQGNTQMLDPFLAPDHPVLVIETHGQLRLETLVHQMNLAFQKADLSSINKIKSRANSKFSIAAPNSETAMQLTQIRINDVQEPWVKGNAEIYAIASGVKGDDNSPALKAIALPYLDESDKNYFPNQLILFRNDYVYPVANLQFFEDDGDSVNYKSLISNLISAIDAIGDLTQQPKVRAITSIANIILETMPDEWFADDDDYVDSCYTLEIHKTYTNYACARNNLTMSTKPFELKE